VSSLRRQIFDAVEVKLVAALEALGWTTVLRNPRSAVGQDQMNAIVLGEGGDFEPDSLTGHVETCTVEFSVGLVVIEADGDSAEELLDAGFVAVVDRLIDPTDIQLGGLAVQIRRGAISPAFVGRGETGSRVVGVQEIGFFVDYWAREGDASAVGP
jgi:hypothetical protein